MKPHVIELKCTGGPFGDQTYNYDVLTDARDIGEFIEAAKSLPKEKCGTFCIRGDKGDVCVANYANGEVSRCASRIKVYCALRFDKITANGGWGMIDYDIHVSEDYPTQLDEEFQMVYWGKINARKK